MSIPSFQKDCPTKQRHAKLVSLVERMLELYKHSPRLPQEKESLGREIEPSADGRIDRLVYELYGLSEDEIRIVEMYNTPHKRVLQQIVA